MRRLILLSVLLCGTVAGAAQSDQSPPTLPPQGRQGAPPPVAQQPAPTPPPGQGPRNVPPASLHNVRIDFTISDSLGTTPSSKKTVTLLVRGGRSGQIRSITPMGFMLNVDAIPNEWADGRIELSFTLEYTPQTPQEGAAAVARLNESVTVILDNGKPLLVTQSADPHSDRKVTLEVTATLMK